MDQQMLCSAAIDRRTSGELGELFVSFEVVVYMCISYLYYLPVVVNPSVPT